MNIVNIEKISLDKQMAKYFRRISLTINIMLNEIINGIEHQRCTLDNLFNINNYKLDINNSKLSKSIMIKTFSGEEKSLDSIINNYIEEIDKNINILINNANYLNENALEIIVDLENIQIYKEVTDIFLNSQMGNHNRELKKISVRIRELIENGCVFD